MNRRGFARQRFDAGEVRRKALLEALADGKEHTTDELRKLVDVGPDTIWRDMRKLKSDVAFVRRGMWRAWQLRAVFLAAKEAARREATKQNAQGDP